jgi:predicted dehydrogenase
MIRAGIVGAGLMGRWHAATIARAHGRLVAVADTNEPAVHRLAEQYPNAEVFLDTEQMLNRVTCDVIHVCTPLSAHERIAALAIEAGCHVIIEKPFTRDGCTTERLLERAMRQRVLVCPVHQFVFQDGLVNAKKHLPRIGPVIHLELTFSSAGGVGQEDRQLDAIVADILPHPLSLMQMFLPDGVLPESWLTVRPRAGELRAVAAGSGLSISLSISMHARPPECAFRIFGANGTIHADLFHGYSFMEPGRVSKMRKILRPFDLALRRLGTAAINLTQRAVRREAAYPGLQSLVTRFYHAVRTDGDSPIAPEAVIHIARVRDELIRTMAASSVHEGCHSL